MTKHNRIISDVPTTDPDMKNIKTKYFRGTDGVLNRKGGSHYVQNIVFYVISVNV